MFKHIKQKTLNFQSHKKETFNTQAQKQETSTVQLNQIKDCLRFKLNIQLEA